MYSMDVFWFKGKNCQSAKIIDENILYFVFILIMGVQYWYNIHAVKGFSFSPLHMDHG